jgi:hypothetical protein
MVSVFSKLQNFHIPHFFCNSHEHIVTFFFVVNCFAAAQGSQQVPEGQQVPHVEEKIFTDEELNTLIDPILQSDDLNRDGFIDYPEFIRAQQRSQQQQQNQHKR